MSEFFVEFGAVGALLIFLLIQEVRSHVDRNRLRLKSSRMDEEIKRLKDEQKDLKGQLKEMEYREMRGLNPSPRRLPATNNEAKRKVLAPPDSKPEDEQAEKVPLLSSGAAFASPVAVPALKVEALVQEDTDG